VFVSLSVAYSSAKVVFFNPDIGRHDPDHDPDFGRHDPDIGRHEPDIGISMTLHFV
jgi:hypothetical protein